MILGRSDDGAPPARILGLGTAVPPNRVSQSEARAVAGALFSERLRDAGRLLSVFETARIDERYLALPLESYLCPGDFAERNRRFVEVARSLCEEASLAALEDAGMDGGRLTHVVMVTSTGVCTPTLETLFGPALGLPSDVRRVPLWGLGCAGGLSSLALAAELAPLPGARVLVCCVELCSLTFCPDDLSRANLVASALFADGAAAAVVGVEDRPDALALGSHVEELIPDSRDVMGWDLTSRGLQVVFLTRIPSLVTETYRATVERALSPHELAAADLECLAVHPGGRKVVQAQQDALGLAAERFDPAREVLRRYGNMSSVTVFHVLQEARRRGLWGRPGILSAFGPGFTSHVIALPGPTAG